MVYYTTASSVAAFVAAPPMIKPLVLHHALTTTTTTTLRALDSTTAVATTIAGMVLQGGAAVVGATAASTAVVDAAAPIILQMDRVRIRLDGLSSYGVICSLLMNAALRLYSATPKKLDNKDTVVSSSSSSSSSLTRTDIIKIIFMISTIISILTGSYTTVVFTLLGLYSKTAIGLGRDLPFIQFFDLTAIYRKLAFDSFLISLVAFQFSFVTSLYLNYDKKLRWWSSGLASILAIFCFWQWYMIIKIASRLLFS